MYGRVFGVRDYGLKGLQAGKKVVPTILAVWPRVRGLLGRKYGRS